MEEPDMSRRCEPDAEGRESGGTHSLLIRSWLARLATSSLWSHMSCGWEQNMLTPVHLLEQSGSRPVFENVHLRSGALLLLATESGCRVRRRGTRPESECDS